MNTTIFRQVGPYEILEHIGHGGIATVFRARDTRSNGVVALKVVADGPDENARETAEAERNGAELQRAYLNTSAFVPRVYDVGAVPGYLYIAMEYLDGADLSAIIQRGRLEPQRAAGFAVQLCQFLEEVDRLQSGVETSSALTLLHNDLKPANIRIVAGDRVKVFDFGAAKTLTMSRRWTKNDFYSTPYLSPECLDSGERDRQTDAWALGVILYEMVAGATPFRAADTHRVQRRILSRRPPDPIENCPTPLAAVITKLLAANPRDRYEDAGAIREDLERFIGGANTTAESEGWPGRANDEPPTRRTPRAAHDAGHDDEPATRRTGRPGVSVIAASLPASSVPPVPAAKAPRSFAALRRWVKVALVILIVGVVTNEGCIAAQARRLAATAGMQELGGFSQLWSEYESLSGRSWMGGVGARALGGSLARQALILADRVADNYRTPAPTVREAQWMAAAGALERALTVRPDDNVLRGTLRYCQGQLHRINGEAAKSRRQLPQAQRELAEAVSAFREAAALRKNWPDPFLGLARTFIYGIEDIDRGADAMNEAQRLGHPIGDRETAQLADGYKTRGDTLSRAAADLHGMPQEREYVVRSRDAYKQAIDLYGKIAGYADVPASIRATQRRLEAMERKLSEMELPWV